MATATVVVTIAATATATVVVVVVLIVATATGTAAMATVATLFGLGSRAGVIIHFLKAASFFQLPKPRFSRWS